MEKPFTNPLALEWLVKADADFVTANRELRARKMPNYDAACFHAQQCVEKLLKSIMIHEGLVPPKSHDLSYLLSLTLPQRPMWEVFRKDFQLLSAYAVEYRYPGESATKEMAREALRCCSKFREQFDREIGRFELK
jgi:HEPN domain-containing protein